MSLDALIYARLSSDDTLTSYVTEIKPTVPAVNTPLPWLVYLVTDNNPIIDLGGVSALSAYQVSIDVVSRYVAELNDIADYVSTLLHGWRSVGDGLQGSFLTQRQPVPVDDPDPYFHVQMTFQMFWAPVRFRLALAGGGRINLGGSAPALTT